MAGRASGQVEIPGGDRCRTANQSLHRSYDSFPQRCLHFLAVSYAFQTGRKLWIEGVEEGTCIVRVVLLDGTGHSFAAWNADKKYGDAGPGLRSFVPCRCRCLQLLVGVVLVGDSLMALRAWSATWGKGDGLEGLYPHALFLLRVWEDIVSGAGA
ncbi:hypothetical protein NicSoilB11_17640 [Arthrobacter sp. NicSoilB11]|nr:hypothetical protein NicSoilB11_17640 [Arthrobacter sp. NicSoilB11]